MKLSDYHIHSKYSFDSNEELNNICEAVIERGITEICFTEHFEFSAPKSDIWPDISEWNKCIDECRARYDGKLVILQGMEIGQPQHHGEEAKRLIEELHDRLDFIIASIHIVRDTGRPSKIVFTQETYPEYFKMYFEELKILAENGDFDVLGHVTFPFRYVPDELIKELPVESFESHFREVFDILVKRNKGIEINTSGYRTSLNAAMPSERIVSWYKEQGGTVISVGSDGHSAKSVGLYIEEGFGIARNVGLEITKFRNRTKWTL